MGSYIPSTAAQREEMLKTVGVASPEALYESVPARMRLPEGGLDLPDGLSELAVTEKAMGLAGENRVFPSIFRGAGAYKHFIPAIVSRVTAKEAFVTAYTPYQPEISQGVLQSIFEYQTMIAELLGMDVANASVYDGATAAAEAVAMCRDRKRKKALVSGGAWETVSEVIKTYCFGADTPVAFVPTADGKTDLAALSALLDDETACVYVQYPNRYGVIEDIEAIAEVVHAAGAKLIVGANPISLGALRTPGECGADVAVGEGQPLGMPLGFGGPYLGFMACKQPMFRQLPGRIVGETADAEGNRCFVLTLQAREQHIRREKASSNICSNEALCAMTAAVYMAAMGPAGMERAANLCYARAHSLQQKLAAVPGFGLVYPDAPFFHEFLTKCPVPAERLMAALSERGILGGLPTADGILWCATECNTEREIDTLVSVCREEAAKA